MKNCENCGIEHDGKYGSGRFCSSKCSRGFSGKKSSGSKKPRKSTIKEQKCPFCGNLFKVARSMVQYISFCVENYIRKKIYKTN